MDKNKLKSLIKNNLPIAVLNKKGKLIYPYKNHYIPEMICNKLTDAIYNQMLKNKNK